MQSGVCRSWVSVLIGVWIGLAVGCARPQASSAPSIPADPQARERVLESYRSYLDALERGDAATALGHARAAVEGARSAFGPDDRQTAAMEINLAALLVQDRAADDESRALLEHAVQTLRAARGDTAPELLDAYRDLARIQARKQDFARARKTYLAAVRTTEALEPADPQRLVSTLLEASQVEERDRHPEAADVLIRRAVEIARARAEQDPGTAALAIHRQARNAMIRRNRGPAEGLYLEAAALLDKAGVRDGPLPMLVHTQLGALYEERGDSARASAERAIVARLRPDGEVIPLVRIEPDYPRSALTRRIQGRVVLSFTIKPDGHVADAQVIDADPPDVFDDSALRAVRRWIYNPKLVDGKPVERRGVQVMLRYYFQR